MSYSFDLESVRKNISTFVFVASYFYFWKTSLTDSLVQVDNVFKSIPFKPIDVIILPTGADDNQDTAQQTEKEESNDDEVIIRPKNTIGGMDQTRQTVDTGGAFNMHQLSLLSFKLLFKTLALSFLIILVLEGIGDFIINPLYISKTQIKFEKEKQKKPKKSWKERMKGLGSKLKNIKNFSIGMQDTFGLSSTYNSENIEEDDPPESSFYFLYYVFIEASYVLVAAIICLIITNLYIKYIVRKPMLTEKYYVKSQVKVVYTIQFILFYVSFITIKLLRF